MTRQELEKRLNDLYRHVGADRFFAPPHLKIADANDPWFGRFKEIIGPYHWTPQEALSRKFANSKALSVIVWILPVGLQARQANRLETIRPSTSWAEVRSFGELLNEELRSQLAALLTEGGFPSCAPHLDQREVYPPPRLGYHKIHFKLVGTSRCICRGSRNVRIIGKFDYQIWFRRSTRLGGDNAQTGTGYPSLW